MTPAATAGAAGAAGEVTVSARGLVRRFGPVTALDGLGFEVRRGELLGLVGPDGAGKTTAIRVVSGLMAPDAGEVRVLGADPLRGAVRERLGLMPQQYSLYRDLSVQENLRFFARLYVLPRAEFRRRAERLLAITRLSRFVDRRADALSGGMYKKLALACALLHEPEVLLLDEPTNGVDPVSRRELWELLHEFVHGGMTVLVSTPYMDEAERCSRVALVHHGKVLLEGEPGALIARFEDEVHEVRGGDRDRIDALLAAHPAVRAASPAGARLRVVVARGAGEELARALAPLGAKLAPASPDFEDLFLAMVRGGPGMLGHPDPRRAPSGSETGPLAMGPPAGEPPAIGAPAGEPPAIEARELTRRFGAFTAVDRVSFEVARGEIFGYLGANGAGKSTTIRMLNGLLAPTGGAGRVAGHDLARDPGAVKSSIGYMSQKFSLYLDLPARENLAFFGGAYGLAGAELDARAEEVLALTDLRGVGDVTTAELPGGLRQRLALACAILHRPEVVFLDEPTAGVDPVARRTFWRIIRDLARGGTTVFVTTHYLDEAEYCNRIGLMVDGRLVALDTPAGLKRTWVPEDVLVVRGRGLREAAGALPGRPGVKNVVPFGAGLHLRVEPGSLAPAEAARLLAAAGASEVTAERTEPSLEDVFLAVVGSGREPAADEGRAP